MDALLSNLPVTRASREFLAGGRGGVGGPFTGGRGRQHAVLVLVLGQDDPGGCGRGRYHRSPTEMIVLDALVGTFLLNVGHVPPFCY